MWKAIFRILTLFMVAKTYVACSEVQFQKIKDKNEVPANTCEERADATAQGGRCHFSGAFKVRGKVDILFVVDNSGSMSKEHRRIDSSFPDFFNKISHLDYRIAITTTDISNGDNPARQINQQGALQDGKLVRFDNGQFFLDSATADAETLFKAAVKRPETLECEKFIKDPATANLSSNSRQQGYMENCPSSDERGIYAANLVVSKNPQDFLRDFGHLAVVVISDEDVRSNDSVRSISKYSMVALDMPDTLKSVFDNKFSVSDNGTANPEEQKSLAVHSIIVKPGDKKCLTKQNSQTVGVKGAEGHIYAEVSDLTGGVIGSVCEKDYTSQMGNIGNNIATRVASFTLDCDPSDLIVDFAPASAGVKMVQRGREVSFTGPLIMNSNVSFSYSCPIF